MHKLIENRPTIDAAAADHLVLEQGEEEGEEEEQMRALELICGGESGRISSFNKKKKALHYTLFFSLWSSTARISRRVKGGPFKSWSEQLNRRGI